MLRPLRVVAVVLRISASSSISSSDSSAVFPAALTLRMVRRGRFAGGSSLWVSFGAWLTWMGGASTAGVPFSVDANSSTPSSSPVAFLFLRPFLGAGLLIGVFPAAVLGSFVLRLRGGRAAFSSSSQRRKT